MKEAHLLLFGVSKLLFYFMLCLEVWRERRIEGSRVVERRIEGKSYPPPCLDVFKIKGRRIISLFIVCNFVNMVKINLVIHLVKHFYALLSLQISPIWEN